MSVCEHSTNRVRCTAEAAVQMPHRCGRCGDAVDLVCQRHFEYWLAEGEYTSCLHCGALVQAGEPVSL